MAVPMLDLKAQFASVREPVLAAVGRILDSQQFILGQPVERLEGRLADYCSCRFAVGVSSGTDALLCVLMALGVGPGDEVITTPFTFFATAGVVARLGARPVFVDIDPATFNIDPARIAPAITPRTRAVLPVHLFGQMADMAGVLAAAGDIPVIEDAAQAIGARQQGRPACSIGKAGCLSFYPAKNLGAAGDAGMILTNDPDLADRCRSLRVHGERTRYHHDAVGGNFRLDALQAAILDVKLDWLDRWSQARRRNAAFYDRALADLADAGVVRPRVLPANESVFNQYVIRCRRRDELAAFLKARSIGSMIYYPLSLHEQRCFASLGYRRGDFLQSERAAGEVLALPIYPELTEQQLAEVAAAVHDFHSRTA